MRLGILVFFSFMLLIVGVGAQVTYVNIIDPVEQMGMQEGDNISLGSVGPGQTVAIVAQRATPGVDNLTGKEAMFNTGWDELAIEDLPEGWTAENSPMYEDPMEAKIKVAPDAADGVYFFKATAIDENNYEHLGNLTINVMVTVDKDVFSVEVSPNDTVTGVGQPAQYTVKIDNNGAASDIFVVKTTGVPAWSFTKEVFVPHGSSKEFLYEVVLNEENDINININVTSASSELISKEASARLKAETSLIADYRATDNGVLIFPLIEQPVYSLVAFLSRLLLS